MGRVATGAVTREARGAPTASRAESLIFNVLHVLPGWAQGSFIRRPAAVRAFVRLHPDPAAVRFIGGLRARHRSGYIRLSLLGKDALLVTAPEGIRHVLDRSPHVYADARVKRLGMRHFQPDALTISRGEEWRARRRFNEEVLASGLPEHPLARTFSAVAAAEVDAVLPPAGGVLAWRELARMFERVALRVLFGAEDVGAARLSERLTRLMREGNRIVALRDSAELQPFYRELRTRLDRPAEGSLLSACAHTLAPEGVRPEGQVPHWMFALRDTLAVNAAHALALLASHPREQARAAAEIGASDRDGNGVPSGATFLRACLDEAMRLWPTTPMIVREALADDDIAGVPVAAGTQVIIHNGFNHRDPVTVKEPDRFVPARWIGTGPDYRFNHMSNGPQACAGRGLAMSLGAAVLARVLRSGPWRLLSPLLDPGRPLPHAIDTYAIRLSRR